MRTIIPVFVWLWLPLATASPNVSGEPVARGEYGPQCTARELSRRRLIVEGERELYIEPLVFTVSGDRVLLAGKPSYIFVKRRPDAMAELESRHAVFGAMIESDGTARIVPAPPVNGGKVTAVAAIASDSGSWRVIFVELDSIATGMPEIVDAHWHGIYDGTRWSALERLPGPDGVALLYYNNSRLAQNGDTVVWAALAQLRAGSRGVALFERNAGVWSHRIPATAYASGAEVVHTPNLGFVLAVLNREQIGRYRISSLFFYPRRSNWQLHRKIELGEDPTITGGTLHFSGETGVVTWMGFAEWDAGRRLELRAMVGTIVDRDEPVVTVDLDAVPQFAPVAMSDGEVVWVTHHSTDSADSTDAGELRLVRRSDSSPEVLWRTAQPYLGGFTATAYSASDVLIAGPQLDKGLELLVSLIIRVRIDCTGSRKPGT